MNTKTRRTGAQDAAKGILIIAVVFFHCFLTSFAKPTDALATFNILMAIFPFLLVAFFFYSGYNYQPSGRTIGQNILRRAKQLLIPMVGTFIISAIVISSMELIFDHADMEARMLQIGNSILHGLMSDPVAIMTGFPQNGGEIYELYLSLSLQWFLYALFICSIFFYLLVGFTNKKVYNLISIVIGLLVADFCIVQFVGVYLPYTVQCYPVILAIMLTAAYLRKVHFLNKRMRSKKEITLHITNAVIAEGIIVGTCLACHYQFGSLFVGSLPGGMFDPVLKGFDVFISYFFAILGTYAIHTLCRGLKYIPVVGFSLQWVGNHSAVFYLFHPIFLDLAAIVIFQKQQVWGVGQAFFYVAVVVPMLIVLCIILDLVTKKKKAVQTFKEEVEKNKEDEDLDDLITE